MDEVGPDSGQVERLVAIHLAVQQNDGDLGFLGFLKHAVPAGRHDRGQQDRIDTLGDEGPDRGDLVFLLLLRVRELEVNAPLLGLLFCQRGFCRTPAGFRPDLRKADSLGHGSGRAKGYESRARE